MNDSDRASDLRADWGPSTSPKTIVVIDDEPDNVDLTVMLLESAGHAAFGSTDGPLGVLLAAEKGADIAVLDYMMPTTNGGEIGKLLHAYPPTQSIKILMCSGTSEAAIRLSFTQYNAFLKKPIHPPALLQAIDLL